jgi:hypothetical protein
MVVDRKLRYCMLKEVNHLWGVYKLHREEGMDDMERGQESQEDKRAWGYLVAGDMALAVGSMFGNSQQARAVLL